MHRGARAGCGSVPAGQGALRGTAGWSRLWDGGLMGHLMRFMVGASSAEIVASILRVSFPDARTALDLTPGRGCFWSETVPPHVAVHFSEHDFRQLPLEDNGID